jgi:hypothetical protein
MQTAPQHDSTTAERQLEGFISKFDDADAARIRSLRKALQRRMPAAHELVYDNYNFLVIGYCSTLKPSHCIVSLAADAHGVRLCFYYGATVPDPHRLLEGSGSQNRFIRLESPEDMARPEVEDLVAAAIAQGRAPLPAKGKGTLIIRSISPKQRPRRQPLKPHRSPVNHD